MAKGAVTRQSDGEGRCAATSSHRPLTQSKGAMPTQWRVLRPRQRSSYCRARALDMGIAVVVFVYPGITTVFSRSRLTVGEMIVAERAQPHLTGRWAAPLAFCQTKAQRVEAAQRQTERVRCALQQAAPNRLGRWKGERPLRSAHCYAAPHCIYAVIDPLRAISISPSRAES